ncbi:hypothetical protein [Pseudoalteromonas denitrificans]|uniref:Uncharacterized protein n=1 Tax=Pseudoalteromonas denitrificans DSM 6059 TaxID=1123010 RepID=A0A1I1H9F9_9GAMM|nr:hypothetical protein [Pseudoalteromonas denitrificans]SFC20594.1 hypothetical protein SAMN02745724_01117 [Pseudoalteromonas denitrificans DSM 6059]
MRTSPQVGSSIISQAYIGFILSLLIIVLLCITTEIYIFSIMNGLISGAFTSTLLLCYWRGKGGVFFILALMSPLFLIVFTVLPSFIALFQLIASYFFGTSTLLMLYGFANKK